VGDGAGAAGGRAARLIELRSDITPLPPQPRIAVGRLNMHGRLRIPDCDRPMEACGDIFIPRESAKAAMHGEPGGSAHRA